MRLDFNVLWVDDQPNRVTSQITAITNKMRLEGFHFNATLAKSMDGVRARISGNVFTDEVDLVLVDWDLGDGVKGQDAIAEIRDSIQYKDVVFYSAQTSPDELRSFVFKKGLEGVYCANREQLVDEVMGVFESLVKKVLDLDHMRGIVMGATSDIDYIVNLSLIAVHKRLDEAGKAKMLKKALGYTQKHVGDVTKEAKKLEGATTLAEFFDSHMILTANDRLRMLTWALKAPGFDAYSEYRRSVVKYMQEVVPRRNRLGHRVLVPQGKPQASTDSRGEEVTVDETRKLRRQILDLRSKFRDLLKALQVDDGAASGDPAAAATGAK